MEATNYQRIVHQAKLSMSRLRQHRWAAILAIASLASLLTMPIIFEFQVRHYSQARGNVVDSHSTSKVQDKCQCQTVPDNSSATENASATTLQASLPSTEFYINALVSQTQKNGDAFDPHVTELELRVTVNLLFAFLDLCEQHGIEVMMYGGTLIGSYRHHGFIPWDDDVDLLLNELDRPKLRDLISNSSTDMQLAETDRWKVWNVTECLVMHTNFCWPYLDISFYQLGDNTVHDTVMSFGQMLSYPERLIFPMHRRPFMGRWLAAPRDTLRFLGSGYDTSGDCVSLHYSHKFENFHVSPLEVRPCESLAASNRLPFVTRVAGHCNVTRDHRVGVLETLRDQDGVKSVYSVTVEEPTDALNYNYTLEPMCNQNRARLRNHLRRGKRLAWLFQLRVTIWEHVHLLCLSSAIALALACLLRLCWCRDVPYSAYE